MKTASLVFCAWSIAVLSVCLVAAASGAQNPAGRADATLVSAAQIQTVFDALGSSIDQQVRIVDIGQGTNVAVGALERGATHTEVGEAVRGLVHHQVTEVYVVLDGEGVLVTGGDLEDPRTLPADGATVRELVGPSSSGTSRGVSSRRIGRGDLVVIPAGTFHGFREIEDHIRYLSIRVDPERVLPAGYANPLLEP